MNVSLLHDKVYGCLAGGLIGDAMGAPVEGWHHQHIKEKHGEITDFDGDGTDDSAIKMILCDALLKHNGHVTADEFAASFLRNPQYHKMLFTPVRNTLAKIENELELPVHAGLGNQPSSSSAMAIAPMGVVNACNPRQAALETYDVAGLIHAGSSSFCRDAACAIAAAVAEAMKPNATVESVLDAATAYLHAKSAAVMTDHIHKVIALAKSLNDYEAFRAAFYERHTFRIMCDSRETVPCVFALFYLANGNPEKAVIYGANFGRDTDTIATMAGALAGAFAGASGFRRSWIEKLPTEQDKLARDLMAVTRKKYGDAEAALSAFKALEGGRPRPPL